MRAILSLVLATASLLAAGRSARADVNELSLGAFDRALRTTSANAVTSDSLAGGALTYGRALGLGLFPNLEVWATAGFAWGGVDGELFRTMATEASTLGLTVGGRAAYTLHSRIAVAGALDLGTARTRLALERNGVTVADAGWGGTAGVALGLDLRAVMRPEFTLGLRIDVGYVAYSAVALAPRQAGDDTKIELDAMQASIGSLDLGGPYVTFAAISQF